MTTAARPPEEDDDPGVLPVRLWRDLPEAARAVVLGFLVLVIGGGPPGAFLVAALRLTPAIPWFLPLTAIWLWYFWRYLDGWGFPASTSVARRIALRATPLGPRVWTWALIAGGLGMAAVMGLIFVTTRFAHLPERAAEPPFAVAAFPVWTQVAIFLALAGTAGVVEEAAFRGVMLSRIQRRHGWWIGVLVVAVMFHVAHLSHAWATVAFVPFFLAYSGLHGLLVYRTRSILPSVVLHALFDAIVLPIQYGALPDPSGIAFVSYGGWSLVMGIAAVPAFRRLASVARAEGVA